MQTAPGSILQMIARVLWHAFRYIIATCISTITLAGIPVLVVCVIVGILLASYALAWVGVLPVEVEEPMSLIIGPIVLMILGAIAVIGIILLALGVTLAVILPVSVLAELSCRSVSKRAILLRLLGFVAAGLLLGVIVSTGWFVSSQATTLASAWLVFGLLLTGSVGFVFLFGLVLTLLTLIKDGIGWLWSRVRRKLAA